MIVSAWGEFASVASAGRRKQRAAPLRSERVERANFLQASTVALSAARVSDKPEDDF